jgi:hypothetical protein
MRGERMAQTYQIRTTGTRGEGLDDAIDSSSFDQRFGLCCPLSREPNGTPSTAQGPLPSVASIEEGLAA